jgi:hypothetical protein
LSWLLLFSVEEKKTKRDDNLELFPPRLRSSSMAQSPGIVLVVLLATCLLALLALLNAFAAESGFATSSQAPAATSDHQIFFGHEPEVPAAAVAVDEQGNPGLVFAERAAPPPSVAKRLVPLNDPPIVLPPAILAGIQAQSQTAPAGGCGTSLERAAKRGVPFVDAWADEPLPAWAGLISTGVGLGCAGRREINFTMTPHGMGSNFIVLANHIIWAALSGLREFNGPLPELKHEQVAMVLATNPEHTFGAALARLFLSATTFYRPHDTMRETPCKVWLDCAMPRIDDQDVWKLSSRWLASKVRGMSWALFNQIRAHLWRQWLRLTPAYRALMDRAVAQVQGPEGFVGPVLAMHVRRSDKVTGEAQYVRTEEFVQAVHHSGVDFRTVVVVSDDAGAFGEVVGNWSLPFPRPRFVSRFAHPKFSRPDRIHRRTKQDDDAALARMQDEGFLYLLTDLRLMVESDWFLGSQSSNLGIVACAVRGDRRCLNVENAAGEYQWEFVTMKITR